MIIGFNYLIPAARMMAQYYTDKKTSEEKVKVESTRPERLEEVEMVKTQKGYCSHLKQKNMNLNQ